MKIKIFILLLPMLFLCACGSNAGTKERTKDVENKVENIEKWNDAYADLLMKKQYDSSDVLRFFVKDINNNGTPELIISMHGTCLQIYTFDKGELINGGEYEFYTGTIRFLLSKNKQYPGIFCYYVGGGLEHYCYLSFNNDILKVEELWNEDFTGISKELGKKRKRIEYFSDDELLINESQKVIEKENDISFNEISVNNINRIKNRSNE